MADDAANILSIWGETLTIVRRSTTYSDTGNPTVTWVVQGTATGLIQYMSETTGRVDIGIKKVGTHGIFFENGTDILEGDRVRGAGWSAGDDEYEVLPLEIQDPSHVRVSVVLTKGHGG